MHYKEAAECSGEDDQKQHTEIVQDTVCSTGLFQRT